MALASCKVTYARVPAALVVMYSGSRSWAADELGKKMRTFSASNAVLSNAEKSKVVTVALVAPLETSINETVPLASLTKVESIDSFTEVDTLSREQMGSPSPATRIVFLSGVNETWSGRVPTPTVLRIRPVVSIRTTRPLLAVWPPAALTTGATSTAAATIPSPTVTLCTPRP